jgi:hypothetical protein
MRLCFNANLSGGLRVYCLLGVRRGLWDGTQTADRRLGKPHGDDLPYPKCLNSTMGVNRVPIWTEKDYLRTKESRDRCAALFGKDLKSDTIAPAHGWPADSAFRSDDPYGGHNNYGWTYRNQKQFEEIWTSEGGKLANRLADQYAFGWPYLIARTLAKFAPETCRAIMGFTTDQDTPAFPRPDIPEAMFEHSAMWGSFHAVRKCRTWPEPTTLTCPVCERQFWSGYITHWMFRYYGPARYCNDCCSDAHGGCARNLSRQQAIEALADLAVAFDAIPSSSFISYALPPDAAVEKRDQWMRALAVMPPAERIKETLGCKDWLSVLKAAGLVADGWRVKRGGVMCHATDGHLCLSLLERSIDDWLTRNGIDHEREPRWPYDPVLNRNGMRRADWLLPDGSFVECAGLMSRPEYALKMAEKRELARQVGIMLHIIEPEDVLRLDEILGYLVTA